jgi:hypothetical protein
MAPSQKPTRPRPAAPALSLQGTVSPTSVAKVFTGEQLLSQLNNNTARYIQLMADVTVPPLTPQNAVSVSRITEVRACHPNAGAAGPAGAPALYKINWANTQGAVSVAGNLIFNGDIMMTGLGWRGQGGAGGLDSVVGALNAQGPGGVVEFEDLSMFGELAPALYGANGGQGAVKGLLRLPPMVQLTGMPANFTLRGPQSE